MSAGVARGTERDEIQRGIFARMAAKFLMVISKFDIVPHN
jgi:hypothetical protein